MKQTVQFLIFVFSYAGAAISGAELAGEFILPGHNLTHLLVSAGAFTVFAIILFSFLFRVYR